MPFRLILATAILVSCAAAGFAHEGKPHQGPADRYVFPLAAPGTYELPPIKPAADGAVVDETGRPRRLTELTRGKVTLLSFVYTQCADVCPLATMRMAEFQELIAHLPQLSRAVRLVTMSFDPVNDTPQRMAEQAELWRRDGGAEWLFVTAPDEAALAPVLKAYDQAVTPAASPAGDPEALSHVLRVFLIDSDGMIRNIYSADFLDARLVLNDVLTLMGTATAPSH